LRSGGANIRRRRRRSGFRSRSRRAVVQRQRSLSPTGTWQTWV
jgi:hypothetical protein